MSGFCYAISYFNPINNTYRFSEAASYIKVLAPLTNWGYAVGNVTDAALTTTSVVNNVGNVTDIFFRRAIDITDCTSQGYLGVEIGKNSFKAARCICTGDAIGAISFVLIVGLDTASFVFVRQGNINAWLKGLVFASGLAKGAVFVYKGG